MVHYRKDEQSIKNGGSATTTVLETRSHGMHVRRKGRRQENGSTKAKGKGKSEAHDASGRD